MEFMTIYWPVLLIGVLIGAIVGYLMFRPRQRVTLSKDIPVRPHMPPAPKLHEGRGIGDEAAAAASDVAGQILGARVHDHLPGASGPPDDLVLLKGVGPKFAMLLNERGITRFDQIASLSPHQVEDIDAALGAFRGRFTRDRIVEQADYLSRGDLDGYRAKFGNL
jgi:predicted flap endonuclease-1-like 5' DNA nuclease